METIFYGEEEQKAARVFVDDVERATRVSALDECVEKAREVSAQIAHAAGRAETILAKLTGPQAEGVGNKDCRDEPSGTLGKLSAANDDSLSHLQRLFYALEHIGKMV